MSSPPERRSQQSVRQAIVLAIVFALGFLSAAFLVLLYLGPPEPPEVAGAAHGPPADPGTVPAPTPEPEPRADEWQLAPGFDLATDVDGFMGPVAITFLNRPGSDPESPLYLVTELRGRIKVVRRDRSVGSFAEIPDKYLSDRKLPAASASYGLHGICLDPEDRRLYTTSVYPAEGGFAYNRITLWESVGELRWEKGRVVRELRAPFADIPVSRGHSIGNCLIGSDGKLWVGLGDGGQFHESHRPGSSAGKLLRLNPDLSAPADNPFYDPRDPDGIRSYVYTMGFRNPWALAEGMRSTVYIADNGPEVDRLVRAQKGYDYPWNGNSVSLTYDNLLFWPQAIGPAAMTFIEKSSVFPFLKDTLALTAAATTGVILMPLRPDGKLRDPPVYVLKRPRPSYAVESVNGVAMGPDGLYLAHMVYDPEEFFRPSAILKLIPGPLNRKTTITMSGSELLRARGCLGCHAFRGEGARISVAFDGLATRLRSKLADPSYRLHLLALDRHPDMDIRHLAERRRSLLAAPLEQRLELWIEYKIRSPRFENPESEMAPLPIADEEVEAIAEYLAANTG